MSSTELCLSIDERQGLQIQMYDKELVLEVMTPIGKNSYDSVTPLAISGVVKFGFTQLLTKISRLA